ncbi:MAG: hypothetical protein V3571_07940, partial [Pseudodesulfovibrio sp.]
FPVLSQKPYRQAVRQVGETGAGARRKERSGPPRIPIRKGLIVPQQRGECPCITNLRAISSGG